MSTNLILDDFTNGAYSGIVITLSSDITYDDPPIVQSSVFDAGSGCTGLIGCERDMSLSIYVGLDGRTFSSEIFTTPSSYYFSGEWAVANPKNCASGAVVQYDGRDNSTYLDINGLGNLDLTQGGTSDSFIFAFISDIDTDLLIEVYSPYGTSCEGYVDVSAIFGSYSYSDTIYYINFNSFIGNCDFTNVGAIELSFYSYDAADFITRMFATNNLAVPSPTPSSTPSPGYQNNNNVMIDNFANGASTQGIVITLQSDIGNGDPFLEDSSIYDAGTGCTGLIGCERDMTLTVYRGLEGRVFTSSIYSITGFNYFSGEWAVSNPKNCESGAVVQYDGRDNSNYLDLNGLGNLDLTQGGKINSFILDVVSDLETQLDINVYSPNGVMCTGYLDVPGTYGSYSYSDTIYYIRFDSFYGNCAFTNVGAIELSLHSYDAIDFITRMFGTYYLGVSSTSATPTPSPSPQAPPNSQNKMVIDNFANGADNQIILHALSETINEDDPIILLNSTFSDNGCSGLIGCGRDLSIKIMEGIRGSVFSSGILGTGYGKGEWELRNPVHANSLFIIQYDGRDNSTSLNTGGLGSIDITGNGNFTDFSIFLVSDTDITITIELFSSFGELCSADLEVQGITSTSYTNEYYVPFDEFEGSCDLQHIGAIQILIPLPEQANIIINQIVSN